MRVLLASPKSGARGGIARWTGHICEYYESISKSPVELSFFDTARKVIPSFNGLIFRRFFAFFDYPQMLYRLRRVIRREQYDIIHFTSSASLGLIRDLIIIRIAHARRIKAVVHFRFGRIPQLAIKRNWEWYLLSKVVRNADGTIIIDQKSYNTLLKEQFKKIYILPNPLAPIVQNIIDCLRVQEKSDNEILFVGHCYKEKGVYELMEACKQIPNVRLKYVGSISESIRRDLTANAADTMAIDIVGEEPYEQIIKDMLGCSVFTLPSYTEGFPNVILEAMACGCAIVATSVGAIPEMLEEDEKGHYGTIVEAKDIEGLRQALLGMLTNIPYRNECKINAMRRVSERYSMSSVWSQMEIIWSNTLKEK